MILITEIWCVGIDFLFFLKWYQGYWHLLDEYTSRRVCVKNIEDWIIPAAFGLGQRCSTQED